MRIGGKDAFDVGQPDMIHHRKDLVPALPRVEVGVNAQHFVDLFSDRHHRIERRHRLLKDHRHGGGAQLPQAAIAGAEKLFANQLDAAA